MAIDINSLAQNAANLIMEFGLKILGAVALLIVGRWLIRVTTNLVAHALNRQRLATTIVGYVRSSVGVLLNVILIVEIWGLSECKQPRLLHCWPASESLLAPHGAACCRIWRQESSWLCCVHSRSAI